MEALANSIYPGRRRSAGGAGDLAVLLGAPFDLVESAMSNPVVEVNGLNQSEAAAGLFTLFAIATALVAGRRASASPGWRRRAVLLTILGVGAVFVAWYLLPVPAAQSGNAAFPQGTGYSVMTITPAGMVSLIGKLGDGTPFSAASLLTRDC